MMNKRKNIFSKLKSRIGVAFIAPVIWLLIVAVWFTISMLRTKYDRELTSFNDVSSSEIAWYITDNTARGGLIYKLDQHGDVDGMFHTVSHPLFAGWEADQVCYQNRAVYAVLGRVREENRQKIQEFEIVGFNEELGATHRTPPIKVNNSLVLTGFYADDTSFYLTLLTFNGKQAAVYMIPKSELVEITTKNPSYKDEKEFEEKAVSISELQMVSSENGRFFSRAEYVDGVLNTRLDNEEPFGVFAHDEFVKKLFADRKMSFTQRLAASGVSFSIYIVFAIVGFLVLFGLSLLLWMRRRVAYAILTYEVVFAVLIVMIFAFMVSRTRTNTTENFERFERYFMGTMFEGLSEDVNLNLASEAFYDTDAYVILQRRIASQIAGSEGAIRLKDILVVDVETGRVALSGSGYNKQSIVDLYGSEALDVISKVGGQNDTETLRTTLQGVDTSMVAQSLEDMDLFNYAVIGIAEYDRVSESFFDNYGSVLRYAILVYVIASIGGLIYFILEAMDIRFLASALQKTANGQENIEKPVVVGTDMNYMWNSLFEIQKKIKMTNHIKFLTYEAYYRFAPKSIERILKKDSITEVQGGDAIRLSGTMALMSTAGQHTDNSVELDRMNHFMEIIEQYQSQEDGIFISAGSDLSAIKLLFLDETRTAARFGIDLLEELREWQRQETPGTSILMHYAPYVYGIAGTRAQAAAFLFSPETEVLEKYMKWFRKMRLGLLITREVIEHENANFDLRYIGFVTPDPEVPDNRVDLYEVLDACSVRIRRVRLQVKDKFAEALDLFYKQDFYFARNSFTEILREMPDDEITKWYLFECERYLNEANGSDFIGALHMD